MPKRRILLVEDERLIAMDEALLLKNGGYEVSSAYSGEEALRMVEAHPDSIDLVLMDIDLGKGIDGTEAARKILELKELPVLFLSAHLEPSIVEQTEQITNYGYVVKSSAFAVLDASIKMAFKLFDSNRSSAEHEREAKRNETQYRELFENSIDAIAIDEIVFDESGEPCDYVYRHVNQAFERVSGRSAAELLGRRASEILPRGDFSALLEKFGRVVATRKPISYEAFHEGIARYLRASAYPGEGSFLTVIIEDLTESKRSLLSLHRRDEYLESIIQATQDGFVAIADDGRITDVNEAFCRMVEYGKDELVRLRIGDLEPADGESRVRGIMGLVKEKGELLFEAVLRKKGGACIHAELSAIWVEKTIDRLICFCRNTDERVRTEALLEQKSGLLTAIFESSPEVIVFALDREYRYIAFNRRHQQTMKQIWGKDIEIGTDMLATITAEGDRAAAKANFDRALAGEHFDLEEMYGDERLTRAAWLDYYSPVLSAEGEVIGLSCFVLNNTERKRAERKIKQLLEEKELVLREVHHRVKNNMNIISALLRVRAQLQDSEAVKATLNDAVANVHSMMLLYDRLYRSEKFDTVPLRDFLASLGKDIVGIFPRRIPVKVEGAFDDAELDAGIASNLGIITNELITNSMKYAFPDESAGDRISIEVRMREGSLSYRYSDSGVGLPKDFSLEASHGFGLQLVKMLADQLRGTIRIDGSEGSRFLLELPV